MTSDHDRVRELRNALEVMVWQYAHYTNGAFHTGGQRALEEAFDALGWHDPHPESSAACQRLGCGERADCGRPEADGVYRWLCGEHYREAEEGK